MLIIVYNILTHHAKQMLRILCLQCMLFKYFYFSGSSGRQHQHWSGVRWRRRRLGHPGQKLLLGNHCWTNVHVEPGHRKSRDGCGHTSGCLPDVVPCTRLPTCSTECCVKRDCSGEWADHGRRASLDNPHAQGGARHELYKGKYAWKHSSVLVVSSVKKKTTMRLVMYRFKTSHL